MGAAWKNSQALQIPSRRSISSFEQITFSPVIVAFATRTAAPAKLENRSRDEIG
jgi:hypothetical protein